MVGRGLEMVSREVVGKRSLCVPGTFNPLCEGGETVILALQRRRPRLREVQQLVQGPTADGNLIQGYSIGFRVR